MPPSFIESGFTSKVAYEKWVEDGCPADGAEGSTVTYALNSMDLSDPADTNLAGAEEPASFGPMEFPAGRKSIVKAAFEKAVGAGGRMELKAVHELLFTSDERGEYGFNDFNDDATATCPGCDSDMAWKDVDTFLTENL